MPMWAWFLHTWLVNLCKASLRMWAIRAWSFASLRRDFSLFFEPFCLRECERCNFLSFFSWLFNALGLAKVTLSEQVASVVIPKSMAIAETFVLTGSGMSRSTCRETYHRPACSETVAERICTSQTGK